MLNHKLIISIILLCFTTASFPAFSQYLLGETEKIANSDAKNNAGKLRNHKVKSGLNYEVKYIKFNLEIDPSQKFIKGNVITYFYLHESDLSYIVFELSDSLDIDTIFYSGIVTTWDRPGDDVLRVFIPHPNEKEQMDSVKIWYHGVPQEGNGFGSFKQGFHNETPIIWTLSQPYGCSDWWPCKNDLADKIDSLDMIVKTPFPNRVASNGLLTDSIEIGSNITYTWKHRYPIAPYLIAFAVTNYASFSDYVKTGEDSLQVLNYVYPENLPEIREQAKGIIPIMELFNELFINYPFSKEKYGHAQFGMGGGMEHQTMSFMGTLGHELMAHELAHMWFGDYITTATWKEIWLNEGFATYCAGLSYENMFNGFYWNIWKSNTRGAITREPGGSVYVEDTSDVMRVFDARLSYHKGAFLLQMLRWKMGDVSFFKGLNNYLNDPELAFGYATTERLKDHLEATSQMDLTEFFNDWLYGEGYPSYNVKCSEVSPGNFKVVINQSQSHPSVSFFEMPVPIKFSSELQDTLIVFDHKFSGQEFMVELGFLPDSIMVDPDIWLISGGNSYTLGIGDIQVQSEISVLPNPFIDEIVIQSSVNLNSEIILFDPYGKMVFEKQTLLIQNQPFSLKTDHVKEGIYILNIETKKRQYHWKMVKIRW